MNMFDLVEANKHPMFDKIFELIEKNSLLKGVATILTAIVCCDYWSRGEIREKYK